VISWNLGPLGIHAAQPYIAQAMQKKAATVMLQEIWIPRGSRFRVQRDCLRKYPEYECYIAAGSDIDLLADTDGDPVPSDVYNDGRAHITVVAFLHKHVFRPTALVRNWHKPRRMKSLEHMDHGCVLWLDGMTHEGEHISIITPINNSNTAGPSKKCQYLHSGRNEKVRRAAENHGMGLECCNVAYKIFHLNKVSL